MFQARPKRLEVGRRSAFSLVEMVMVVTIIGIVSAIAVPRVSTASTRASANALNATLATIREVIDCYYAEHGRYPGYNPATGAPDGIFFVDQLTQYTDYAGNPSPAYSSIFRFGPYVRKPFPKNPTNQLSSVTVKARPSVPNPPQGTVGWVAVLSHGYFGISATDVGLNGVGVVNPKDKLLSRGPSF